MDINKIKEQVKLKIAYTNFLEENKKITNIVNPKGIKNSFYIENTVIL